MEAFVTIKCPNERKFTVRIDALNAEDRQWVIQLQEQLTAIRSVRTDPPACILVTILIGGFIGTVLGVLLAAGAQADMRIFLGTLLCCMLLPPVALYSTFRSRAKEREREEFARITESIRCNDQRRQLLNLAVGIDPTLRPAVESPVSATAMT